MPATRKKARKNVKDKNWGKITFQGVLGAVAGAAPFILPHLSASQQQTAVVVLSGISSVLAALHDTSTKGIKF
jgi:uncharacterized membrane protein HdeD (DUF308 family)